MRDPQLTRLPARIDGVEDFRYVSHMGHARRVRRVALAGPALWREATRSDTCSKGLGAASVVLVNSSPGDAAHYERLRAGLPPC